VAGEGQTSTTTTTATGGGQAPTPTPFNGADNGADNSTGSAAISVASYAAIALVFSAAALFIWALSPWRRRRSR